MLLILLRFCQEMQFVKKCFHWRFSSLGKVCQETRNFKNWGAQFQVLIIIWLSQIGDLNLNLRIKNGNDNLVKNSKTWLSQWPTFKLLEITYLIGKISRLNFYFMVLWLSRQPCSINLAPNLVKRIFTNRKVNKQPHRLFVSQVCLQKLKASSDPEVSVTNM